MTSETPAQRLGRYVRTRRRELKMTQADVQAADGPSTATLRLIEGGKHTDFRDGTGGALESAIKWAPGSIDATLAGGEPTPLQSVTAGGTFGWSGEATGNRPRVRAATLVANAWATLGDMNAKIGASLEAQSELYDWTQERIPEADWPEHERLTKAAEGPLFSALADYAQRVIDSIVERDPKSKTTEDIQRLTQSVAVMRGNAKTNVDPSTPVDSPTQSPTQAEGGEVEKTVDGVGSGDESKPSAVDQVINRGLTGSDDVVEGVQDGQGFGS